MDITLGSQNLMTTVWQGVIIMNAASLAWLLEQLALHTCIILHGASTFRKNNPIITYH